MPRTWTELLGDAEGPYETETARQGFVSRLRDSLSRSRRALTEQIDDAHHETQVVHALAAASSWWGRRRETICEIPSGPIVTPYSTSAASIVRFWWVMTMNCASSA